MRACEEAFAEYMKLQACLFMLLKSWMVKTLLSFLQDSDYLCYGYSVNTPTNSANILNSVRNHIPSLPSWLSGGAKKPEEAVEATPATTTPAAATATSKEDDASSATGGADSDDNQVGVAVISFCCCFVPSRRLIIVSFLYSPGRDDFCEHIIKCFFS